MRGEDGAEAANAAKGAPDRGGDADVEGLAAGLQVRVVTFNKVKIELRKVKLKTTTIYSTMQMSLQ